MDELDSSLRERIRREEILREEVRRELDSLRSPPGRWTRVIKFLNTNLGMWLLTTIAFGTVLNLYGCWQKEREAALAKSETIRRLDTEIAFRLALFEHQLSANPDGSVAVRDLTQPDFSRGELPEFKGRSLQSLLFELRGLVSEDEKRSVDRAYQAADSLRLARISDSALVVTRQQLRQLFQRENWYAGTRPVSTQEVRR